MGRHIEHVDNMDGVDGNHLVVRNSITHKAALVYICHLLKSVTNCVIVILNLDVCIAFSGGLWTSREYHQWKSTRFQDYTWKTDRLQL